MANRSQDLSSQKPSKSLQQPQQQPFQTSLLLSPPGSGFAFNNLEGSALLVPVSQSDIPCETGLEEETTTFLEQTPAYESNPPLFQTSAFQRQSHNFGFQGSVADPFAGVGAPPPVARLEDAMPSGAPPLLPSVATIPLTTSNAPPPSRNFNPYSRASSTQPPMIINPITNPISQAMHYSGPPSGSNYGIETSPPVVSEVPLSETVSVPHGTYTNAVPQITHDLATSQPLTQPQQQLAYRPVQPHWFYCQKVEKKQVWVPFSLLDSVHLEEEHNKNNQGSHNIVVATDGGRYDIYLQDRLRCAVYWEEESTVVRRATWFYRREGERTFIPYEEHFAEKLEEEYYTAVTTNTWHRRLEFPEGETVVIHNPSVIVHYQPSKLEKWEGSPEGLVKPSVVKRGIDDYENIEDGEPMQIDHLVFVVHGIGAICDLKFRTLPEVVNDFRSISASLLKTHFRKHADEGKIGRIEFLPASWHTFLHGEATGIDDKLKPITLKSIPKLRYFANDAILDVLFYTSPVYCQAIINQVSSEINRLYELFLSRNPTFQGRVSLAGHSLGSVILFDLLLHQSDDLPTDIPASSQSENLIRSSPLKELPTDHNDDPQAMHVQTLDEALKHLGLEEYSEIFHNEKIDMNIVSMCSDADFKEMGIPLGPRKKLITFLIDKQSELEKKEASDKVLEIQKIESLTETKAVRRRRQSEAKINYIVGPAGTGHPCVIYPNLNFQPTCFFALGSPIAMFLTVRGMDMVWDDFKFPTCPAFFNIFHPYDPVAYRIEPLVEPQIDLKPVLIPHHKGRKRMHLEIKESLSRVGADLKQKLLDSLRTTWNTIHDFARAHRATAAQVEAEMDRVVNEELKGQALAIDDDAQSTISNQEYREEDIGIGQLNGGRRIDYVLQEKPIESFNEYLFALGSHTCYWESEDTVLLLLKEIYASYGIHPSFLGPEPPAKPPPVVYQPYPSTQLPTLAPQQMQSSWPSVPSGNASIFQTPAGVQGFSSSGTIQQCPSFTSPSLITVNPAELTQPIPPPTKTGMDPTAPPSNTMLSGPPPLSGFVRQSVIRK